MQIFPKMGIRLADDFRTADFDRTDNEGGGCKGECHAVVVVGVDGGCRSVAFEWMTRFGEGGRRLSSGRKLQGAVFGRVEHDAELPKFVLESGDAIGLFNMERCEAGEAKGATEQGASDDKRLGEVGSRRKVADKNSVRRRCAFGEDSSCFGEDGFHPEGREEFSAGSVALYTFCAQTAEKYMGCRIGRERNEFVPVGSGAPIGFDVVRLRTAVATGGDE